MELKVVRLDTEIPLPAYAHYFDAGLDLCSTIDVELLPGGGRATVPTGVAIELSFDCAGLIVPRSGLASKHGITCVNAPGLIDSGYRGEIKVVLANTDPSTVYRVRRLDRIAQLVIIKPVSVKIKEVSELNLATDRADRGFGSTG